MSDVSMLDALLTSYEYNRSEDYMIEVYEDCLHRLLHIPYPPSNRTDAADIIFGTAVLLWGEYGTSPRYGWFENERTTYLIGEKFRNRIKELRRIKERDQ